MSKGRFAEVVETNQSSGNGKKRLYSLQVFGGGSGMGGMDIADRVTDPEGVWEEADPLAF
jgi:hypothetical protein